jgi:hypothetical protein
MSVYLTMHEAVDSGRVVSVQHYSWAVFIKSTYSSYIMANPFEESLICCFSKDFTFGASLLTVLKHNGVKKNARERD